MLDFLVLKATQIRKPLEYHLTPSRSGHDFRAEPHTDRWPVRKPELLRAALSRVGSARELAVLLSCTCRGTPSGPARGSAPSVARGNRSDSGVYTREMDKKMWRVWGVDVFLR